MRNGDDNGGSEPASKPNSESGADRQPVERLASQFVERRRRGESPTIDEYVERYPQWGDEIRALFPAVLAMEGLRHQRANKRADGRISLGAVRLTRLGDYRMLREIGRGGMGIVYEAEQVSLSRRVAVKVLPRQLLLDSKQIRQFRREARLAGRLHHANIVPVFGVGQQDGFHYYVMQLIDGFGLDECVVDRGRHLGETGNVAALTDAEMIDATRPNGRDSASLDQFPALETRREGQLGGSDKSAAPGTRLDSSDESDPPRRKLSHREVAIVGMQVAAGLAYAHEQGTLHRDIKPSNLLMDRQGVAWITDFGLAKALGQEAGHTTSRFVGTLRYMAPEQLEGRADSRSDVYSLGISLYELISRRPAFDEQPNASVMDRIRQGKLAPLRQAAPRVSRDLETIIMKAAAHDPADRYQTAEALADDLGRHLEDRPIRARRASWLELGWRWSRRNPALAMMSAVICFLLCSLAAISLADYVRIQTALDRETTERQRYERTGRLATGALDSIFDRFAPESMTNLSDQPGIRPQPILSREAALLLENLLHYYDELASQEGDRELRRKSAQAQCRVADIHQRLGHYSDAIDAYQKSVQKYSRIPGDDDYRFQLACIQNRIGGVYRLLEQDEKAREHHRRAIEILHSLESNGSSAKIRYQIALSHLLLACHTRPGMGPHSMPPDPNDAASIGDAVGLGIDTENLEEAIGILLKLRASDPKNPTVRHLLAICYRELCSDHMATRTVADEHAETEAIALLEELAKEFPDVTEYRYELMQTYGEFSVFGEALTPHQLETARQKLVIAIQNGEQVVAERPAVTAHASSLVHAHYKLASVLRRMAQRSHGARQKQILDDVESNIRRAIQRQAYLVRRYPEATAYLAWLGKFQLELGRCLQQRSRHDEARTFFLRSIRNLNKLPDESLTRVAVIQMLGEAYQRIGEILREKGEQGLAEEAFLESQLILLQDDSGRQPPSLAGDQPSKRRPVDIGDGGLGWPPGKHPHDGRGEGAGRGDRPGRPHPARRHPPGRFAPRR